MSLIEINSLRKWCLIGIEDHQGVLNVGGRVGAAKGPAAFWNVFKKLRGKEPILDLLVESQQIHSHENDSVRIHSEVIEKIEATLRKAPLSVIVGGGHDHGYTHLAGIKKVFPKKTRLGCINIDAHLDVRPPEPVISSGSPFYLALEEKVILPENFVEFGIQSHCNGPELWKYTSVKKVKIHEYQKLRNQSAVQEFKKSLLQLSKKTDAIVISFDLDACAEAFAPGVSAPQSEGFSSQEVIAMMEIAGQNPKVVSLGIFELNPLHDQEDKTARLAATCAFHFLQHAIKKKK